MRTGILLAIAIFSTHAGAQSADGAAAVSFLSYVSSKAVHRPLKAAEVSALTAQGPAAIPQIVAAWGNEPAFAEGVKAFVEDLMRTSGSNASAGVSYELPGYLGRSIALQKKPYSELLTATSCVNASGQAIACDSQAPFSAGVLSTRAFLITYKGAYNISRAGKVAKKFLCTSYPFSDAEEPRLAVEDLIPQFATTSGAITFGNGNNCYSCHAQFGRHAQFFVKFDLNGVYRANATGLQKVGATDGYSENNLLTSHLKDPARAADERSQMLGRAAANLREAAGIVTESPRFLPCAAQQMMKYYMRIGDAQLLMVHPELYKQIAEDARKLQTAPSFVHILQAILSNPNVFNSYKKTGARL